MDEPEEMDPEIVRTWAVMTAALEEFGPSVGLGLMAVAATNDVDEAGGQPRLAFPEMYHEVREEYMRHMGEWDQRMGFTDE